jgi:hypothetical protein
VLRMRSSRFPTKKIDLSKARKYRRSTQVCLIHSIFKESKDKFFSIVSIQQFKTFTKKLPSMSDTFTHMTKAALLACLLAVSTISMAKTDKSRGAYS